MTETSGPTSKDAPPRATPAELARTERLSLPDLLRLTETMERPAAAELYKIWIAFNEGHPHLHLACFNHSAVLRQIGDVAGSIHALRACLRLDPKFGAAHINLGLAMEESGVAVQAVQQWRAFAEMTGELTADRIGHRLLALQHIGRVMENAGLMEDAENALWQAMELRPDKLEASQHWSALRQRQCKWPILQPSDHVSMRQQIDGMSPLALACYADDPLFQLAKARRYNKTLVGQVDRQAALDPRVRRKHGTGQRLRVGYVSSDLRDHAVGFALREVLELHDKESVEIYAYYCGDPVSNDATQARMKKAVDCWRDIARLRDAEAAQMIAGDEIDILIDVNGYTKHARTAIFAYRPAPVIVNFCGYPGSMGSPFHHYMIADERIVPPESEIYYSEKVLRIACNQPIDRKRVVAATPSRADVGLPEDAFVFACFNGMQKITQETFGRWMAILRATPGSVLWLLSEHAEVDQRLRAAAEAADVEPDRLIFAPKVPNAAHLARIALADLFLDTFPYGAHSTGADALTVGLPVLTFPGKGFAARFCHSIVAAAGVPELICASPDDYVAKAIDFARDPRGLEAVRRALQAGRDTSVLRDIPALARRLEELFWYMQRQAEQGQTPAPDLRNLDVYYEIGAGLLHRNTVFTDGEAYRLAYRERLEEWHTCEQLPYDDRLWKAPDL